MAGLTKEQRAARNAQAEAHAPLADAAPVDDGLVEVEKMGETLRVHPSCVKAHTAAGWKLKG